MANIGTLMSPLLSPLPPPLQPRVVLSNPKHRPYNFPFPLQFSLSLQLSAFFTLSLHKCYLPLYSQAIFPFSLRELKASLSPK